MTPLTPVFPPFFNAAEDGAAVSVLRVKMERLGGSIRRLENLILIRHFEGHHW
jgi:hypothetical protein